MPVPKKVPLHEIDPLPQKAPMGEVTPLGVGQDDSTAGEGTYKMVNPKTSASLDVPFSHVLNAGKSGFQITPDDFKRFSKDYTHSKGIRADIDAALSPEDESTWSGRGLNVFKGGASGIVSPFMHPVLAAQQMGAQQMATGMAPEGYPMFGPVGAERDKANTQAVIGAQQSMAEAGKEAREHPVYAVSSIVAPALLSKGLAEALPKVPGMAGLIESAPEWMRTRLREKFGGGTDFTEKKVGEFANDNEKARAWQKAADEVTEAKRGGVDDVNAERQAQHQQRVQEHQEKVASQKEQHAERVAKHEKKKAQLLKDHQDAVKATQQENEQALRDHLSKVDEVAKGNQAAQGIIDSRQGLEKQISTESAELTKRIEDAQKKADAENDKNWEAWRNKVGQNTPVDMQPVVDAIEKQTSKMNPQQVSEFRDIMRESQPEEGSAATDPRDTIVGQNMPGKTYNDLTPQQKEAFEPIFKEMGIDGSSPTGGIGGNALKEVPVSRLHGWKDMLEKRVRSIQDGVVRNAVGQVLDAVRKAETDISAKMGAQAELDAARASHAPFVEAFRNSPNEPPTVASAYAKAVTPEFVKDAATGEMGDMLGKYDPRIPELGKSIMEAREKLKALPSEDSARRMLKPLPEPPTPKPMPEAPEIPEPPKEPTYAKPPKEPSTKPYREPEGRPATPAAEDFTPERMRKMRDNIKKYGSTGQWAMRLIFGAAGEYALSMFEGNPATAAGKFGTAALIGSAGLRLMANILQSPRILEWMARPTAEDIRIIETLPPADAARLKLVINGLATSEMQKTPGAPPPKVAPAVAAFLGEAGAATYTPQPQSLQQLKDEAEKRVQAVQPAPGPQSRSNVPAGVTHVYDPSSGTIVPV